MIPSLSSKRTALSSRVSPFLNASAVSRINDLAVKAACVRRMFSVLVNPISFRNFDVAAPASSLSMRVARSPVTAPAAFAMS